MNLLSVVILNYILEIARMLPNSFLPGAQGQDLGGSETIMQSYNKEYIR